ncbi:hypothetical protein PFLUV_G00024140 [Perca fluviatilis]|uniref:Uncharacterized protein n=1 Tax=Perca fluviatilis TaxID=8168 RepID=A0A6A5EWP4_PERFL|nr:hypothetical protein PFLUV_G00024140 [Perca fluviatilis]
MDRHTAQGCYVLYLLDINSLVRSALSVGAVCSNTSSTSAVARSTLYGTTDSTKREGGISTTCLINNSVGCRLID